MVTETQDTVRYTSSRRPEWSRLWSEDESPPEWLNNFQVRRLSSQLPGPSWEDIDVGNSDNDARPGCLPCIPSSRKRSSRNSEKSLYLVDALTTNSGVMVDDGARQAETKSLSDVDEDDWQEKLFANLRVG